MFAGAAGEVGQGEAGLAAGVGGDDERDAERLRAGEAHAHGGEQEAPGGWTVRRVCEWNRFALSPRTGALPRDHPLYANSVVEPAEITYICCWKLDPSPQVQYENMIAGGARAVAGAELAAVGGPSGAGGGVRGAAVEEGGHRHVGVADQRDHQLGLGREGRQGIPPGVIFEIM